MKCYGKNDLEDIFPHKIVKGKGTDQYSNFKSKFLQIT